MVSLVTFGLGLVAGFYLGAVTCVVLTQRVTQFVHAVHERLLLSALNGTLMAHATPAQIVPAPAAPTQQTFPVDIAVPGLEEAVTRITDQLEIEYRDQGIAMSRAQIRQYAQELIAGQYG